jgi:hypothetical protein
MIAAGPARILAIAAACGVALLAYRWLIYRGLADGGLADGGLADRGLAARPAESLAGLLWWIATALAVRSVFEPVMVAYYLWPPLAVALVAAAADWPRLLRVGVTVVALTFFSQVWWRNPWAWWTPLVAALALVLYLAHPGGQARAAAPQVLPEAGEEFVADGAP